MTFFAASLTRVADSDGFYQDPTFEKNTGSDHRERKPDPDPTFEKSKSESDLLEKTDPLPTHEKKKPDPTFKRTGSDRQEKPDPNLTVVKNQIHIRHSRK